MKAVRFVGSGGQGIQVAAVILAEAAVASGAHAACTHTYGPESRGGASRADVLVDETEIIYPRVSRPDVLVLLSREGGQRHLDALAAGGTLIYEHSISIVAPPAVRACALPIVDTAKATGGTQGANVVALGALCEITGIVSRDSLIAAMTARMRSHTERNRRALDAGIDLARHLVRPPAAIHPGGTP